MRWREYEARVQTAWQDVLDSHGGEERVQTFLERHPALVPGAFLALGRVTRGHGPFPSALISQPPLKGLTVRTPDFLWISRDSAFLNPIFIVLEDPDKPWLKGKGKQHHKLTDALGQLQEWRRWFNEPLHRLSFLEYYEVPKLLRDRQWAPIFVLVYGRQAEDPKRIPILRASLRTDDTIVIPYENLEPDWHARSFFCVRNTNNAFEAVAMPPTLEIRPAYARDWRIIRAKEEAAAACEWATQERREFLVGRFSYWDEWALNGSTFRSRDKE